MTNVPALLKKNSLFPAVSHPSLYSWRRPNGRKKAKAQTRQRGPRHPALPPLPGVLAAVRGFPCQDRSIILVRMSGQCLCVVSPIVRRGGATSFNAICTPLSTPSSRSGPCTYGLSSGVRQTIDLPQGTMCTSVGAGSNATVCATRQKKVARRLEGETLALHSPPVNTPQACLIHEKSSVVSRLQSCPLVAMLHGQSLWTRSPPSGHTPWHAPGHSHRRQV